MNNTQKAGPGNAGQRIEQLIGTMARMTLDGEPDGAGDIYQMTDGDNRETVISLVTSAREILQGSAPHEEDDSMSAPEVNQASAFAQAALQPIGQIIANLSKPIKARHLKQKVRGGQRLDFIPWYHAVKYLDLHAPGWGFTVKHVCWNAQGRLVLSVTLSIPALEGVISRDATGTEEEPEEGERMYGDPSSNAESMALRRAAAKFGLGLYLYHKDKGNGR